MKKAYSKPQIAFDSFELSQGIAGGCGKIASHAQYVCGYQIGRWTIFEDDIGEMCNMEPQGENKQLCYDVPTEAWQLFSS